NEVAGAMKLFRKYLLYAATTLVVFYSLAVLYRVQTSVTLGIECMFTDEAASLASAAGPEIQRVEVEPEEVAGLAPRLGDTIVRVAGKPVPTFIDFKYLVASL